jgi:hypothetical protein
VTGHIDAATRGASLSLTIDGAMALINKMVSNQSLGKKKITKRYAYREGDGYACYKKIDLLMKRLVERAQDKQ